MKMFCGICHIDRRQSWFSTAKHVADTCRHIYFTCLFSERDLYINMGVLLCLRFNSRMIYLNDIVHQFIFEIREYILRSKNFLTGLDL